MRKIPCMHSGVFPVFAQVQRRQLTHQLLLNRHRPPQARRIVHATPPDVVEISIKSDAIARMSVVNSRN